MLKKLFSNLTKEQQKFPGTWGNNTYCNSVTIEAQEDNFIKIVPVGKFPNHPNGAHEVTKEMVAEMAENLRSNASSILFDFGHESMWNPAAKAAGWSNGSTAYANDEGLFIEYPRFTTLANDQIKNEEFKYFSPVYRLNSKSPKGSAQLISVAITNTPFFEGQIDHIQNSIINKGGNTQMNSSILSFFELPDDADESTLISVIDEVINTTGKSTLGTILNSVSADNETSVNHVTLVENAINEGKIIPAEKEMWLEYAKNNPEKATTYLNSVPQNSAIPPSVGISNNEIVNPVTKAADFIKSIK